MMGGDNLAAVLYDINDLRLEQRPIPQPKGNEVLLRMANVGICGSDVHYYQNGRIGDFIVKAPMVIGHEASGVVERCGPDVKHLKKGDRVALEPGVPCRFCKLCKSGRYNLCPEMAFCATPPVDGNLIRYFKHPEDFCFKLPDNVNNEEGAFLEPLSVAVYACRRGEVKLGDKVLVCGAGPIGLLNMLTAKAMGARQICVTDVVQSKLDFAKKTGADIIKNVKGKNPEQIAKEISEEMDGPPDVTLECSGAESSIQLAIFATRPGGTVVIVGMGAPMASIPIVNAGVREVDIKGIFRYVNCYPAAMSMIASGKIDVKPLITHRFKIEDTLEAFHTASKGDNVIKIMLSC